MPPDLDALRYPIGPWQDQVEYSPDDLHRLTTRVRQLPEEYTETLLHCSPAELARTYRPGSWTVQQLVTHVADTHVLHLVRFKHTLTAPGTPAVTADINAWAALEEARTAPVSDSLLLFKGLHERIAHLAETLHPDQWSLSYYHPTRQRDLSLAQALDIVVWHAEHHLAHIRLALKSA